MSLQPAGYLVINGFNLIDFCVECMFTKLRMLAFQAQKWDPMNVEGTITIVRISEIIFFCLRNYNYS